jgi:hypothetical protein
VIALPLLWKRPRAGSIAGVVAAVLFVVGVPLDYLGFIVTGQPPHPVIFYLELVESGVVFVLAVLCYTTYSAVGRFPQ